MEKLPAMPSIVVDSREQAPYVFDGSVRSGLVTGDYSLVGCEARVAIERKSLADAYSSIGHGRARFEREWQRLSALEYGAVVIEATMPDFLVPPSRTSIHPNAALNTYLGWSVKYGVPVFFAGDRRFGKATVYRLLSHFWRYE